MYAKQYEITLPADYDMRIIRERVARAGHVFDDRAGLGLKAFLIRDRGVDGSPVNQYAPFYLWADTTEMTRFLIGGAGFQNIVRDFGRPVVQHWAVAATFRGPASGSLPRAASRRITPLPADDPELSGLALSARIDDEIEDLRALARAEDVHTAALGIDPHSWQLVRFVLWRDGVPAGEATTERYDVLHLSAPGLAGLPDGRHW